MYGSVLLSYNTKAIFGSQKYIQPLLWICTYI